MVQPDYRGARGSNAGDDFHELWALRQALALLDQDTGLTAVAVEGLRAEDESGTATDTWDGIDCTLYYGGDHVASATRVVVAQLKYSAANPDQPWSIVRLTQSSNKKQDNSVIGRLAKAFAGLQGKRPDLIATGNVVVRLISNQPVDPAVFHALSGQSTFDQKLKRKSRLQSGRVAVIAASGLRGEDFETFARALDLSECGRGSRFALEERVLATITGWTEDDARAVLNDLMRSVRRAMMPEAKGELITRQSVLLWMGFSDLGALFPCPPTIKRVDRLIPREASRVVAERLLSGEQRICLHGEGGCGKTTALQEIEALLPRGSAVIIFDCYGSGRYLDSDAYRHRPPDAFLQLSNDLARPLRIPLLISRSADLDYPRVFKKRLEKAAEVVASRSGDGLLVVVVDAADNSVVAATTRSPQERSFVHDFAALGELPGNVRLVVTARTGRLSMLNLPHDFASIEMNGFIRDETAVHVRSFWSNAPDAWIDEFHYLSHGNPRVQRYALDYAGAEPARALDHLRPNGKDLEQIFREQLECARDKAGADEDIRVFCAGLIALPRPVPIGDLAAVTGFNEAYIRDLCADFTPGVRLRNESIGFADEDFEHFVRTEADPQLRLIQSRMADHFLRRHRSDAYAAAHVAEALLAAGRGREIIDLITTEPEPTAIGDPVLRREAQLKRFRVAMKVCREAGDTVEAMLTLLIGAEAIKTDEVIRRLLIENPDLAANFARDTSRRIVLRDPKEIEHHGPLLFHLMAADARQGDGISVREGYRQILAWLKRRDHANTPLQGWDIHDRDIAAEIEAVLRGAGPRPALEQLRRWRPRSALLRVALTLSFKLIVSGEAHLIERCIAETRISPPWDLFLLTPLALAGGEVDPARLESSLARLLRHRLIRLDELKEAWRNENATAEYLDMILTACEVIVARGGDRTYAVPVLERMASRELRRRDRLFTSQVSLIDLTLRAHALLERLAGHQPTLETYWVDPPEPSGELPSKEAERVKRADAEKRRELQDFIGPLVDIYDVRAQALIGSIASAEVDTHLRKAIAHYSSQEYRLSRDFRAREMRTRAALSITRLMALRELDRTLLLELARAVLNVSSDPLGSSEVEIFANLALDRSLHQQIIGAVAARAKAVRTMRTSAEDKLTALTSFARLLLPISYPDAESLLNEAIEVAGEVNVEAIHEIALFAPLAEHAVATMDVNQRRTVGCDLAIVVSDAGIRLAGNEYFPWGKAAQALTTLDVSLALAAAARWEDSSVVNRASFLPHVLEAALDRHELAPVQVAALSSLLDRVSVELMVRIIDAASEEREEVGLQELTEDLAREELLQFGRGTRQRVNEKLTSLLPKSAPGYWLGRLVQASVFHQKERPGQASRRAEEEYRRYPEEAAETPTDPLDNLDWVAHRFISPDEIEDVVGRALAAARASEAFVAISTILDRLGSVVAMADRVSHLDALSQAKSHQIADYELVQALARRIDEWHEAPSVSRWCRERLMLVVVDLLPSLSRWLAMGESPLPVLLEKSGVPPHHIAGALIEGLERHVDVLDAPMVYALVGLIGRYCRPMDAAQVMARYADRLVQRIPVNDLDNWDLSDIPTEPAVGLARFLYALMGDVDVRTRWRAAHALRRLARLGDVGTLARLVALYDRRSEQNYRTPDAPFYWLASRLWFIMALDRIAAETPSTVGHHGQWLLEIASNDDFPHILVRSFAKAAVCKLVDSRAMTIAPAQRNALKRANTSLLRRKKRRKPYSVGVDRLAYRELEGRRFSFDSMDTLRYWYPGALRIFADVSGEEFLNVAERWIVDRWGVRSNPWRWDDEPRQHRFPEHSLSLWHSQGSLPILERFHTYLEWHAMWCAAGELMRARALAQAVEDEYDTFERWLSRDGLTESPLWLADLRGAKPLEDRLWFGPQDDVNTWVENVGDDDFVAELGLGNDDGPIVIGGYHETRSHNFMVSVRVETALVSPDTARALVRALQTVDDSWDYRIPPAGHDLEIEAPPYKLVGWLVDVEHELGVDERDPLRHRVRAIECRPAERIEAVLNLKFIHNGQARWIDAKRLNPVFTYEAWGDSGDDESEERFRYDETVRSSGWRLRCDRDALRSFLNRMSLDLIVEVEITRRNKGYDYSRYNEEGAKEARFDRVLLLRRDGTIEAAEGRLGTWAAPRA